MRYTEYKNSDNSYVTVKFENAFKILKSGDKKTVYHYFDPQFYIDSGLANKDRLQWSHYNYENSITLNYESAEAADFTVSRFPGTGTSLTWYNIGVSISKGYTKDKSHSIICKLQNKDVKWFQDTWKDVNTFSVIYKGIDYANSTFTRTKKYTLYNRSKNIYSVQDIIQIKNSDAFLKGNILFYETADETLDNKKLDNDYLEIVLSTKYVIDRGYGYEPCNSDGSLVTESINGYGIYGTFRDSTTSGYTTQFTITQTMLAVEEKVLPKLSIWRSAYNKVSWDVVEGAIGYAVYIDGSYSTTVTTNYYALPDTATGVHNICVRTVMKDTYCSSRFVGLFLNYSSQESNFTKGYIDNAASVQTLTFYNDPQISNILEIGKIASPVITIGNRYSVNSNYVSWNEPYGFGHNGHDCNYSITVKSTDVDGNETTKTYSTKDTSYLLPNLKMNNTVYVKAIDNVNNLNTSFETSKSLKLSGISLPEVSSTQTDINELTLYWGNEIAYMDTIKITLNGTSINTTGSTDTSNIKRNLYKLGGLICGNNTITLQCINNTDSEFNSSIYALNYNAPKLETPVLYWEDYPDEDPNKAYVKLYWANVKFAKDYVIYHLWAYYNPITGQYEKFSEDTLEYFTLGASSGTNSSYIIRDTSTTRAKHIFTVQSVSSDESIKGFNSAGSNAFEYEHTILTAPVISYKGQTSIVEWSDTDDENADRYLVTTYANGVEDNIVTVVKGKDTLEHNIYSAVKNPYNITLTYSTYVTAMSNNAFYFYPSNASNVLADYQAIVLEKAMPTYDYDTGIISWNAVANARGYKLTITSSNGATEHILGANTTSFDISLYTQDLYNIAVQALGSQDSITDRPYYLNSWEIGMISVGILNPPVITRTNNVLFWESVGADYYDIYQNNVKIKTVYDGTSNTDLKTVRAVLDAVPVGTYSYKVKGYYSGNNGELFESNYSNTISVTVTKLAAPTIEFEYGLSIVNWTEVANAEEYDIYVGNDDVFVHQDLTNLTHTVYKNESSPTYYPVTIKSVNNTDHFAFIDSDPSNELKYYVYLLETPELSLDTANRKLVWNDVEHTHHYTLTLNNEKISVSTAFYDVSELAAATYTVYIQATPAATLYPNPRYIESKMSNIVTFGTLSTPVISVKSDSTRIIWDEIPNADFYDIYDNGEYLTSTNLNSYTLNSVTPRVFTIYIIAKSNSDNIFDSNLSNTIQFTFVKLDQVQNVSLRDSTNVLSWTPVPNTKGYGVYSNGKVIASLQNGETSYNMTQFMKESIGKQEIYVIALGEYLSTTSGYIYYLNSDKSNSVIKIVQATQQYNVVINGVNYTSIELPFTYNATIDESLDTANIKICHINRELPFEAYSDASLCIYDSSLKNPSMVINMLVATDEVTEVQLGNNTLWDHKLSLIERTRLLQSEIMPSFSVTQPKDVVTTLGTELASPKLVKGTFAWNRSSGALTATKFLTTSIVDMLCNSEKWYNQIAGVLGWSGTWTSWIADKTGWKWLGYLNPIQYLIDKNSQASFSYYGMTGTTSIKKEWKVGDTAVLPIEQGEPGYGFKLSIVGKTLSETFVNEYTTTRKYYIRKHTTEAAYNSNYPETLIATVVGPNAAPTYTFTEAGDYDIILEIDDMIDNYGNRIGLMSDVVNIWSSNHVDIVENEKASTFEQAIKPAVRNFAHYRVVWNIKAVNSYSEPTNYVSIKNVLEKIVDIVEPIDVNETAKYQIKSSVLSRTANIKCPELAIQNGKTLYEVLAILGKEFNGIPRLELVNGKNVISYDILNETTVFNISANEFKELNVEAMSGSSIDNHSTGFVSNISNLVSDTYTTIYPAGDLYTTARADTSRSAYMDISSMIIEVDQPIYKFCNLFATNVFKNNPDTVVDLTEFVYEKNIYDTLPDTQSGKGCALYYKQGENKINGLGRLSEASGLYEALGWSSDVYVLQRIINKMYALIEENDSSTSAKLNFSNWESAYKPINDIQFKVRYVPVINTVSYIEQSTITDLANYNYKNFNQEDNIVSDSRLFKSANEQLKRLGNNSIQKLYTTYNMSQIPLLGYQTTINGDVYYIDVVSYEFNNRYIDSSVNYSKNINKINERIGVDSTYRKYEIYGSNYINRTLNFNDYCFLDFKSYTISNKLSVNNWPSVLYDGLYGNGATVSPQLKPDAFYINACRDKYGNKIRWKNYNGATKEATGIVLSASATCGLNSIQFSATMYDNFSAGTCNYENVSTVIGTGTKKKKIVDVRYVDNEGKCDFMKVTLTKLDSSYLSKLKYGSYDLPATLPLCNWLSSPDETFKNTSIFSKNIKLKKDNREKIAFNYQMHFISKHKDIYIGNGLTKYLFKNPSIRYITDNSSQATPIWVGYRTPILSKSTFSGNVNDDKIGNFSITKNSDNCHLTINGFNYTNKSGYIGYALVWPKTGEILLDVRRSINGSGKTDNIYLSLSNVKI